MMKKVRNSVSLEDWGLESAEAFAAQIKTAALKMAEEALEIAMDSDDTYIFFPAEWGRTDGVGGKSVADPLTIYLRVGLCSYGEQPTYEINIREEIGKSLATTREDGSFSENLPRVSRALRELADEIDDACKEGVAAHAAYMEQLQMSRNNNQGRRDGSA